MVVSRAGRLRLPPDPRERARALHTIYEDVLSGADGGMRSVVLDSWQRALNAGVDPDRNQPPHTYDPHTVRNLREEHPLAAYVPVLRELLVDAASEAAHVMVVTNATGDVLWIEGPKHVLRRADRLDFVEGARWTEEAVGTNAIGTALHEQEPVQVFSAEHLVRTHHDWTCSAAPIVDPESGDLLGVVDVSGPYASLNPDTLALVRSAARVVQEMMRSRRRERDNHARSKAIERLQGFDGAAAVVSATGRVVWSSHDFGSRLAVPRDTDEMRLANGAHGAIEDIDEYRLVRVARAERPPAGQIRLLLLHGQPHVMVGEVCHTLSLRRAEILALLASRPEGMTADELALELYGDDGNPTTTRAELHRIRQVLGEIIAAKPYRFAVPVEADFLDVRALLADGDVAEAVRRYDGPLLPRSTSLAVVLMRDELHEAVRRAAVAADLETLKAWVQSRSGRDDAAATSELLRRCSPADPMVPVLRARLARLREEYGTGPRLPAEQRTDPWRRMELRHPR